MDLQLLANLKVFGNPTIEDMALISHCVAHRTSFLAAKILQEDHEISVCQSGAGYYVGANDAKTGEPVARDSMEYWPTQAEAQLALDERSWTQRLEP